MPYFYKNTLYTGTKYKCKKQVGCDGKQDRGRQTCVPNQPGLQNECQAWLDYILTENKKKFKSWPYECIISMISFWKDAQNNHS